MRWILAIMFTTTGVTAILAATGSTASENVMVLEEQILIPVLNRNRTLRVYLPPDYHEQTQRYPVLYMFDGQNLFDNATAFMGEWQVDEALNQLYDKYQLRLIVVGIDNGAGYRTNEYSPWSNETHGGGEGALFIDFIVNNLRPYIAQRFRTLKDPEFNAIMGSSLGGLMSHTAILAYPEVFKRAGIYSPAYWFSDEVYSYTKASVSKLSGEHRIEILGGTHEGQSRTMDDNIEKMRQIMQANMSPDVQLKTRIIEGGEHNETLWSEQFSATIMYLFKELLNNNNDN